MWTVAGGLLLALILLVLAPYLLGALLLFGLLYLIGTYAVVVVPVALVLVVVLRYARDASGKGLAAQQAAFEASHPHHWSHRATYDDAD